MLGSQFYVSQLSKRDIKKIALNLNFDMLGSPNLVRFVYDGDGSDTPVKGPRVRRTWRTSSLTTSPPRGSSRSRPRLTGGLTRPFIAVVISAGGLFSGTEGLKTPAQVAIYGGTAGEQYDPCYHEACDTFDGTGDGGGAKNSAGAVRATPSPARPMSYLRTFGHGLGNPVRQRVERDQAQPQRGV